MKLPIALIDELERRYTESGGAPVTAAEFRALAEKHGVPPATIAMIFGRSEEAEELLAKLKTPAGSLSDLKALLELFPDGSEQFAAIANRLTRGLQPDPSAPLH